MMLSVQAARMASASSLLFIKRPKSATTTALGRIRARSSPASYSTPLDSKKTATTTATNAIGKALKDTTTPKAPSSSSSLLLSVNRTLSSKAAINDDYDDEDVPDDVFGAISSATPARTLGVVNGMSRVTPVANQHHHHQEQQQQQKQRAHLETWMINLDRDDSDVWLQGPRIETEWYTGKAPQADQCPGMYQPINEPSNCMHVLSPTDVSGQPLLVAVQPSVERRLKVNVGSMFSTIG